MSLVVWFYLNSFSCQGQSQLKWFTNVSSLLYWRLQTTETPGSFFTTACCPSCKIFFKISNSNVLELYLFINARMAWRNWRTAETCVAKYNWWWVYYQNIVTYLPKCVLEAPCMIVVLYCVNSLLQPTATGGLCGVRLTLYGLVISTAVGSSPAHGRRGWCRCVWLYTAVRLCDVPGSMLSSHLGHVMYFTAQKSEGMVDEMNADNKIISVQAATDQLICSVYPQKLYLYLLPL